MPGRRAKGDNHAWRVTVLLGCWLALGVACPLYCRCVTSLYIYCDNRNISDADFISLIDDSPNETTFIDLSDNNLTRFQPNIFSKFIELVIVDASNNEIEEIQPNIFSNLPVFQRISLDGNKLTSLQNQTFSNMPQLHEVHLNRNEITYVDLCTFSETPSLRVLSLSHNRLTAISRDTVTSLKTLTSLDISYNRIETFVGSPFTDLVSLKTLQASYNNISSLKSLTFLGLTSLEYLHLDGNSIQDLYTDFFTPFKRKIKTLTLSFNKVRIVRSKLFTGMPFLEKLDLSHNEINYLGDHIVPGLSLVDLKLQGNSLAEIPRTALALSRKISNVDLSHNEITSIANGAFSSFKESVYRLNLEVNQLTQILVGMFDGMKYLQSLNLANNTITFIQEGAFAGLINLNFLDLTHNHLMIITPKIFDGVLALKQLDLHYNPLRQFEWTDFSMHQNNFVINLNLSFENVTHTSAKVKWPYSEGTQIYWSQYVTCLEASSCPFRTQAEFLAPYSRDVTIGNFSPSSTYFVCVNPEFKAQNIQLRQCGLVTTPRIVTTPTSEGPPVTEAISSRAAVFHRLGLDCYVLLLLVIRYFQGGV